jgi:hypothetical protein
MSCTKYTFEIVENNNLQPISIFIECNGNINKPCIIILSRETNGNGWGGIGKWNCQIIQSKIFAFSADTKYITYPGEWHTAGNGRFPTENTRKLEEVFRSETSRIFSSGFRQLPVLSERILRKSLEKIRKIPGGNTASMFQIFFVFSCKILRDPVAGMIDLGIWHKIKEEISSNSFTIAIPYSSFLLVIDKKKMDIM